MLRMYGQGKYFLADLVMAAEIYKEAQEIILGSSEDQQAENPQVIFGTVEKDIHDIGKNIAIATLRQYRMSVLDLGVDVSAQVFVEEAARNRCTYSLHVWLDFLMLMTL